MTTYGIIDFIFNGTTLTSLLLNLYSTSIIQRSRQNTFETVVSER